MTATIKYSQDTGHGAWKSIELGAEGTVDTRENWQTAQAYLYAELGKQLKSLWSNGNGAKPQEPPEKPAAPPTEPEPTETPAPPAPATEHHCQEHDKPFKRYSRGDSVWWSHKTADGKWCREK